MYLIPLVYVHVPHHVPTTPTLKAKLGLKTFPGLLMLTLAPQGRLLAIYQTRNASTASASDLGHGNLVRLMKVCDDAQEPVNHPQGLHGIQRILAVPALLQLINV